MYAELVCRSNFTFLEGASHPEELVARAGELGLSALALTDRDGLYGVVKAHLAAKEAGLPLLVGSRLTLDRDDGAREGDAAVPEVLLYAQSLEGYRNLCGLISEARMTRPRGAPSISWRRVAERSAGLVAMLPEVVPFDGSVSSGFDGSGSMAIDGSVSSAGVLADIPSTRRVAALAEAFPGRFYLGASRILAPGDDARLERTRALGAHLGLPLCAHNDVHTHRRTRQPLQDVLCAIRHGVPVSQAGRQLLPNAERTMKGPREMAELFADSPELVGRTLELAGQCRFSLDELTYRFSQEEVPEGLTAMAYLRELCEEGLAFRYPNGTPADVRRQLTHELALIEQLDFPGYFLALWDIVRFARERGILCQGRGSAANSIVCYALRITAIDPVRMGLLFERFLSVERGEPPDIDVDFEHARREEVLQYVYEKHGRQRAGMVCEVISYRGRLAVREVGKALGLSLDQVDRLAKGHSRWGGEEESRTHDAEKSSGSHDPKRPQESSPRSRAPRRLQDNSKRSPNERSRDGQETADDARLRAAGLSPDDPTVQKVLHLSRELMGFPRHLSIHVGGFVVTSDRLDELVPLEPAAMKDRTVVQWDKDDVNAAGILKVDLLGLGMLSVLARAFELIERHEGRALTLATIPAEDPAVYDMLCEGDAIGVFQVESRAQMGMLPRLRPRRFYDLVIQIALIRPGPIIGDMVHPYLRRREGTEAVRYPGEAVREILEKTLGVPLFQEQAMKLAMVAAGFSGAEADQLRRILSHKRAPELLGPYRERFIQGCLERGYPLDFAEGCFKQFQGFAHYGFPESHSASFALIAYASAYLKRHHPAAFTAALLNAQPMGFYAPHTLVEDLRHHGGEVRPVDVNVSDWECTLEPGDPRESGARDEAEALAPSSATAPADWARGGPALRLGLRQCKGLQKAMAARLVTVRKRLGGEGFRSVAEVARLARLPRHVLVKLALAGAFRSLVPDRRRALWAVQALGSADEDDLFFGLPPSESEQVPLPPLTALERVVGDYDAVGLSLEQHPLALLRRQLAADGALRADELTRARPGRRVRVGGLAIVRQRPPTAKGICFVSLEDETGIANLVIPAKLFEERRAVVLGSLFLYAEGPLERRGRVANVKVERIRSLSLG